MDGHFETLVYTDCRPGQGLRGSAGLQFQARSADAVAVAETLVKDHLLYEPPSRWMADRRPVADYPPSFGHLSASGYLATAAGVYRGQEANGVREGNQLTHAIVTTDPDSYAGLRPAQLYGAAFWSSEPAPTTRSEPVKLSPSGGFYTAARAKQFVLDQPDGPEMLLSLVSALETAGRSGGGRVMFLGDDVATIVDWLVAGTLLVPRRKALELGFKIYSNDPARSSLPIVAVHPEFAGAAARIDNQLGYVVFDLNAHRHSVVAESVAARRWVRLFLDEDPRDAVDALDVAAESGIADGDAAAALGLAAILHREPTVTAHAKAIVGWMREGPQRLRDAYGPDLADIFVGLPERWPRDVLRLLDRVGSDGLLLPGEAAGVRIALVLKDIDEARHGGVVTAERPAELPDGEWTSDDDDQVRQSLLEAIRHPAGDGPVIEALLRVAHCYRAEISRVALGDAGRVLAHYLADHPDLMHPEQWPSGADVDNLVIEELRSRVRGNPLQHALVGDDWRDWLRRRSRLPRDLTIAMLGALVRHGDDREKLINQVLAGAASDPTFYAEQVEALFSQCSPTEGEMYRILESAPAGTPPIQHVFDSLIRTVGGQGPVTSGELTLCADLNRKGLLELTRPVEVVLGNAERFNRVAGELRQGVKDPARVAELMREFVATAPRLIATYQRRAIDALVNVPCFAHFKAFFAANPGLLESYQLHLVARVKAAEDPTPVVAVFWLSSAYAEEDPQRATLDKAKDQWTLRAGEKQLAAAGEVVAQFLGKQPSELWDKYVESLSSRRRRYRLAHPFGGRS